MFDNKHRDLTDGVVLGSIIKQHTGAKLRFGLKLQAQRQLLVPYAIKTGNFHWERLWFSVRQHHA